MIRFRSLNCRLLDSMYDSPKKLSQKWENSLLLFISHYSPVTVHLLLYIYIYIYIFILVQIGDGQNMILTIHPLCYGMLHFHR